MKKVKFILIGSLLHCNAFAQLPSADSFVVSNIHFGDTQQDVRKIAIGAGLVLVTKGDFEPLGGFPTSLSYELYRKPCAICVNIPVDPRYESLEIQYSRLKATNLAHQFAKIIILKTIAPALKLNGPAGFGVE